MVACACPASLRSWVQLPVVATELPDAARTPIAWQCFVDKFTLQYLSDCVYHMLCTLSRTGHSINCEGLWLPWVVVRQRQSRQLRRFWQLLYSKVLWNDGANGAIRSWIHLKGKCLIDSLENRYEMCDWDMWWKTIRSGAEREDKAKAHGRLDDTCAMFRRTWNRIIG